MAYASVLDVRDVYDIEESDERVQALLDVAEARLIARVPSLPRRVASGSLDVVLVKGALVDIVGRALSVPVGVTQESETTGPYTKSVTFRQSAAMEITAADLVGLLPAAGLIGSARLLRPPSLP